MKPYVLLFGLMLVGCSPSRMGVQAALPLVETQVLGMQQERDPELAKQTIRTNLKILEGLLKQDPDNTWILENLAGKYFPAELLDEALNHQKEFRH